jgi:hypothetical protein
VSPHLILKPGSKVKLDRPIQLLAVSASVDTDGLTADRITELLRSAEIFAFLDGARVFAMPLRQLPVYPNEWTLPKAVYCREGTVVSVTATGAMGLDEDDCDHIWVSWRYEAAEPGLTYTAVGAARRKAMNDKIRMLEAKRKRLLADLEQIDLALVRAKTGRVIEFCTKLDREASVTQGACMLAPGHEGPCRSVRG